MTACGRLGARRKTSSRKGPFPPPCALEMRKARMGKAARAGIGVLLLMVELAGCGAPAPPVTTAQQECERSGGAWRDGTCARATQGGY